MCGIIGYVGSRACQAVLLEGLRRLEYRGYDSAGIAWREDGSAGMIRSVGNLDALQAALADAGDSARPRADGHGTDQRAGSDTPGGPRTEGSPRATPILTMTPAGRFKIVLNGIIENHVELRERLTADLVSSRQTPTPRSSLT